MERYALTVQRIGLVAIANLLIALSGIILLPVLTKTLPITSYGSWALVVATISLLPVITSLGLRQTMIRFLAASKDKHDIQEVFYSLAFVVFVAALVVSGPFFIFAHLIAASLFDNNVAAALIFPLNVFVACLNLFIVDFFRAFQQAKKYLRFNLLAGLRASGPGIPFCPFGLRITWSCLRAPAGAALRVVRNHIPHHHPDWVRLPEVRAHTGAPGLWLALDAGRSVVLDHEFERPLFDRHTVGCCGCRLLFAGLYSRERYHRGLVSLDGAASFCSRKALR